MKNNIVSLIVTAVIFTGIGFFIGSKYQGQKTQVPGSGQMGQRQGAATDFAARSGNGNGPQAQQGMPVNGEITSVDNGTLTVKTQDGASKIIVLSAETTVQKSTDASLEDLVEGVEVMVIGDESSDNTITAETISIGSTLKGMPGVGPMDLE